MGSELGNAIRMARLAKGLSQEQLGEHFRVSHSAVNQWEAGTTTPIRPRLIALGKLLGQDFAAIADGSIASMEVLPYPLPNARRDPSAPSVRQAIMGRGKKVEVKGQGVCGPNSKADFRFNGQTVGYVQRPASISGLENVFAVYAMNDSLSPRYETGNVVYVDPDRPPAIGDYVVVELYGQDDEPGDGYIKKLVKRTPTKLIVLQHNPEFEIEFALSDIKSVFRVIPWDELIGR